MQLTDAQIKRFVLDTGLVSRKDIDAAHTLAAERSLPFTDALRSQGSLTDDDIRRASAYIFGVPFVSLVSRSIEPSALRLIPEAVARKEHAIVFAETPETIEVALLDLARFPIVRERIRSGGRAVLPRITDEASLHTALRRYQHLLRTDYGNILTRETQLLKRNKDGGDVTIGRIVDTLFHHALSQQATAIFIEPADGVVRVRYRIGDTVYDAMELPTHAGSAIYARVAELARLTGSEDLPRDGRFRMTHDGEKIALRVRTLPVHNGIHTTIHLTRAWAHGFTLDGIGMHGATLDEVTRILGHQRTALLIAGPVASGKTTLLYTLLDAARTPGNNVFAIEDSIGASLVGVNQVCTRPEIGFDAAAALRAALRADPDTIALDTERISSDTAALLASASIRGARTITVLQATSASEAIATLSTDTSLASFTRTLTHILGTGTIRTLGTVREKHYLTAKEIDRLREVARMADVLDALKEEGVVARNATWSSIPFFRIPLDTDDATAYSGTTGIYELMHVSPANTSADAAHILAHATAHGMFTLVEDAIMKAAMGITTIAEVFRIADAYYHRTT